MEFKFLPTPKTFLSLITIIIVSCVAISYESNVSESEAYYEDGRRVFLLVVAYMILIYNAYYLAIKTNYIMNGEVSFPEMFISWFYNLLAAFLGAILISYLGAPYCEWKEGVYKDWRKDTIIGLSSVCLALSLFIFCLILFYHFQKGKKGAKFILRLTPAKLSARSL